MPNKYTEAHKNYNGPGDARPTAQQIIEDEGLVGKMGGKVALVTGGSSGIGIPTIKALATTGMRVFATVRNMEKGQKELGDVLAPGKVELIHMDNTSMESVRTGAKDFLDKSGGKLNILICNAGVMAVPTVEHTKDGFEMQFGTNHVAHFLLFDLVKDAMMKSSTPEFNSRVVTVSSSGHRRAGIRPNSDYNFTEEGSYDPWVGYGQSKTSNIYMANSIDRLYGAKGLHALSIHPGGIYTGLQIHVSEGMKKVWSKPEVQKSFKSVEQGAATQVYAAVSKAWEGRGGRFLEDCDESPPYEGDQGVGSSGYAKHAYNKAEEDRLWRDSEKFIGAKGSAL
jgi:NAD(P)-dependent dehydrogenase (short-subunit alcohol dehydrogenase family)